MKKVVVLGATGRLGAYSAMHLLKSGYEIIAVGHRKSDFGFWGSYGVQYIGDFDLSDAKSFQKLPISNVDAIVHLAGAMPSHTGDNPIKYVNSIVDGMINVCEWMKVIGCKRIVFNTTPSDVSQHFSKDPVPENASRSFPHNGGDHAVYAIAKNAAVDILTHYSISDGLRPCVFRHLSVYSWHPNQYRWINGEKKLLPYRQIMNRIIAGGPVEVWGDRTVRKELLYIKDFTAAIERAVATDVCGLFNLPGYRPYTTEEQIDGFIAGFATQPIQKIYCPEKPSSPENLLLLGGAQSQLGWQPRWQWPDACKDWATEAKTKPFAKLWEV